MSQSEDRYLFKMVEGGDPSFRVVRFAGNEGLSELFEIELTLASDDDTGVSGKALLGRPALFTMLGEEEDASRVIHGIVSRFEQGDHGGKIALYHLSLVPRVWRLQHRHDCRIFQALEAPEIIATVLRSAGISPEGFRLSLQRTYRLREHCVQYRESDWAFVCRLMEEEGVFYFFEHQEDEHVLVLADDPSVHASISGDNAEARRRRAARGQSAR